MTRAKVVERSDKDKGREREREREREIERERERERERESLDDDDDNDDDDDGYRSICLSICQSLCRFVSLLLRQSVCCFYYHRHLKQRLPVRIDTSWSCIFTNLPTRSLTKFVTKTHQRMKNEATLAIVPF